MTKKQVSWFILLTWLPTLLLLMVMTKLLWGTWETVAFEKITEMMRNTVK